LQNASKLFSCLAYSSTMKVEEIYPSETSVNFQQIMWGYSSRQKECFITFYEFYGVFIRL
jgi:hypothetical protein